MSSNEVHRAVLREVRDAIISLDLAVVATVSQLRGPAGNREFFYRIVRDGTSINHARIDEIVGAPEPMDEAEDE